MQSKLSWIIIILFAFLLGTGFYLFYERYEDEIWIGASQEAKRNPFLAAQRFLQGGRVEVVTETVELNFAELAVDDAVFLSEVDSMLVSKSQIDAAMDWIEQGGFMLVGVGSESEGHDSLLTRFNIEPVKEEIKIEDALLGDEEEMLSPSERMREINRQIKEKQEQEKDTADDSGKRTSKDVDAEDSFNEQLFDLLNIDYEHEYFKIGLGESIGEVHLAVLDRITLRHPWLYTDEYGDDYDYPDVTLSYDMVTHFNDEKGTRFIQFESGQGMLTVLSSSEMWDNDHIGLADHALFLRYFVPENSRLHLFYNFDVPSLFEILNRYFKELLWSAGLMLLFWLWYRGLRVQRTIPVPEGQRRNFAEHLHASAKFLTAKQQYAPLLNAINDDINSQMAPFYPGFSQLNSEARVAALAERTQLPVEQLRAWLGYCDNVRDQDELLMALKLGKEIRNTL